MALATSTSQVFLGVRIGCAPSATIIRSTASGRTRQFYDLAAYFGKTRRVEQRIGVRLLGVRLSDECRPPFSWPPEE